jgi:hypothetical protein
MITAVIDPCLIFGMPLNVYVSNLDSPKIEKIFSRSLTIDRPIIPLQNRHTDE